MTFSEWIETLADEEKAIAAEYAPMFVNLTIERAADLMKYLVTLVSGGELTAAYKLAVSVMTADEKESELDQRIAALKQLNKENAEHINQINTFVTRLIETIVSYAKTSGLSAILAAL